MTIEIERLTLPSDPEKQRQFKIMLNQCLASLAKQDQENEAYKDVVDEISKQFALPTKIVTRLVKALHKQNFTEVRKETELLDYLYDMVVK